MTSITDELSIWAMPDSFSIPDLSQLTNLHTCCFEYIRFHLDNEQNEYDTTGGTVEDKSFNNQGALDNSNCYVMGKDWFGSNVYSKKNVEEIKKIVSNPFITVSGRIDTGVLVMLKQGQQSMTNTINAIVKFVKNIGFSGVDLNVEGVSNFNGNEIYIDLYIEWCNMLGNALHEEGLKFRFVTIPEGAHMSTPWQNKYINQIKSVDQVVVMVYDLQSDEGKTPIVTDDFCRKSIEKILADGIPKEKIVLGNANYGYIAHKDNVWGSRILYKDEAVKYYSYDKMVKRESQGGELYREFSFPLRRNGPIKPGYMYFSDQKAFMRQVKVGKSMGINKFCLWVAGGYNDVDGRKIYDWYETEDFIPLESEEESESESESEDEFEIKISNIFYKGSFSEAKEYALQLRDDIDEEDVHVDVTTYL
jgi:hypothetical protein